MKSGILYISHGSRVAKNNEKVSQFVSDMLVKIGIETPQQLAFLEGENHPISAGIQDLVQKGVKKIIVVPLLLFTATHVGVDIPNALTEAKKVWPKLQFVTLPPIAEINGLVDVLVERICMDVHTEKATLFLIAHGSSKYLEIIEKLDEICQNVNGQLGIEVKPAFLHGKRPYKKALRQENGEIIVFPFFLLDGLLVSNLKKEVEEAFPEATILPSFNLDDRLKEMLVAEIRKEL